MAPTRGRLREHVAEELRVLLARKRISATELARRTGIKQSTLSRRMTGETAFDMDDLETIADALGVDVHDLLPSRQSATRGSGASATVTNLPLPEPVAAHIPRPRDNRPSGHPVSPRPLAGVRSSYVSRSAKRKRD